MKKILNLTIIILICMSCGDSFSKFAHSINNQTEYDIILYFTGQEFENQDPILCPANQETIIFLMEDWSIKRINCSPCPIKEYIKLVVDDGKKHLIKDFANDNNWECTGDKNWSFIMAGSYYAYIKSTFVIMEDDLE